MNGQAYRPQPVTNPMRVIVMVRRSLLALACIATLLAAPARAKEQRVSILNGSVAVQALSYVAYPVKVDVGIMTNPRITGHVTASGGSGNDIEVVVFAETQFINWKNKHNQGSLFTSGLATACDVNVPLGESGTYYVLLSNVFSTLTPKTVEGKLALVWTPPPPPPPPTKDEQKLNGTGIAVIIGVLVFMGAIGGLIVWLVMSRKKKASTSGG